MKTYLMFFLSSICLMSFVLGNNESGENNISEMIKSFTSNDQERISNLQIYLDKEWIKVDSTRPIVTNTTP